MTILKLPTFAVSHLYGFFLKVFFIAFVSRIAYGPPNGEWLPSLTDLNNSRGRPKPLPTVKSSPYASFEKKNHLNQVTTRIL